MNKIVPPIVPYWGSNDVPEFISRTEVGYAKLPIEQLGERGIVNKLFDSLIAGLPEGCIIAGGFMTNLLLEETKAKDIDIFCTSEAAFINLCNLLLEPPQAKEGEEDKIWAYKGYKAEFDILEFNKSNKEERFVKFTNQKALSIQVMKMYWYDSPEHVIDTFDLTIAQVAADKRFIYMNPLTQLDLSKKRLVLHRMQFPASTIRRIVKYASKGFYCCPGSLVNIATKIQQHQSRLDIDEEKFVYLD